MTGTFQVTSRRYGDEPFPYLRVFRERGTPLYEFLTNLPTNRADNRDALSMNASQANWLGISVTADTLHLTLYGAMTLTPNGWAQSSGVRCSFQRIKQK